MGRRLYDNEGEFVWKYAFGGQDSEVHRLADEYGIGSYLGGEEGPGQLVLTKEDLDTLKEMLHEEENKSYVITFLKEQRKIIKPHLNEQGKVIFWGSSFDDIHAFRDRMREFWKRGDVYFLPMCRAIYKKARDYFRRNGSEAIYEIQDEY